jgi:hypothetical protein
MSLFEETDASEVEGAMKKKERVETKKKPNAENAEDSGESPTPQKVNKHELNSFVERSKEHLGSG